jgi:hypothetical protein
MMGAIGAGSYTSLRDGLSGITGASNMQLEGYLSSSEDILGLKIVWDFESGDWDVTEIVNTNIYVRACLVL